jgi:uroporphyrinogen decarboxylase
LNSANPSHPKPQTAAIPAAGRPPRGDTHAPEFRTDRDRFLAACRCEPVERPPVWLMRQAGRSLPEYRALRERHSFLELVKTPELAAEVTLQPVRRFGFDAAILFSDILVVPECLGQRYALLDTGGIRMEFAVESQADVDRLAVAAVAERSQYVMAALRLIKRELQGRSALIGFAGAPWTLAHFMLEGGSAKPFRRVRTLLQSDARLFHRLCEKIAGGVAEYLRLQVAAGAEVVQLFDTLAGELDDATYFEAGLRWVREIVASLAGQVPVIVFAKGINRRWDALAATGAQVLGVDWQVRLAEVRNQVPPQVAVQGNLDPAVLLTNPVQVRTATRGILDDLRGVRGHVFNLGHGVPPDATLENLQALVDTVRHGA